MSETELQPLSQNPRKLEHCAYPVFRILHCLSFNVLTLCSRLVLSLVAFTPSHHPHPPTHAHAHTHKQAWRQIADAFAATSAAEDVDAEYERAQIQREDDEYDHRGRHVGPQQHQQRQQQPHQPQQQHQQGNSNANATHATHYPAHLRAGYSAAADASGRTRPTTPDADMLRERLAASESRAADAQVWDGGQMGQMGVGWDQMGGLQDP